MSWGIVAASVAIASSAGGAYMSIQGQRAAAKGAQMSADWNADQARKQAKFEEETAQENMRRKRENNRRAIARERAKSARGGLQETGAVAGMLTDKAERLQQDVDDIWNSASTRSEQLRGQAQMSLWEGEQAQTASKYAIYGTLAKGAGQMASAGVDLKKAMPAKKPPVV